MSQNTPSYKLVKIDSSGKRLKENSKKKGELFVMALVPPEPGSKMAENHEKRRILLKRADGTAKPAREFALYPNRQKRSPAATRKAIEDAVAELEQELGFNSTTQAIIEADHQLQKKKMISSVFENDYMHYMANTVSPKTYKHRTKETLKKIQDAFDLYLKIFKDHPVDQFPKTVKKDFSVQLAGMKYDRGGTYQPQSVRSHGISLNSFFTWMAERDIIAKSIKLDLPDKNDKPPVRVWSDESLEKIEANIRKKLAAATSKHGLKTSRRKNNGKLVTMSKGTLYLNHLRAWILFDQVGMRLAEIWALPKENIDLINGMIYVRDVNRSGGLDTRGNKFQVVFNVKGGKEKTKPIPPEVVQWLRDDEKYRSKEERWFLDRGNGSNAYSNANSLGRAIERHQEEVGVKGEAKRTHGTRATVITDLLRQGKARDAQQVAGHESIETTVNNYGADDPKSVQASLSERNKKRGKKIQPLKIAQK